MPKPDATTIDARPEAEIFDDLRALCTSPGFIHAIAYFCWRDNLIRYAGPQAQSSPHFSSQAILQPQKRILIPRYSSCEFCGTGFCVAIIADEGASFQKPRFRCPDLTLKRNYVVDATDRILHKIIALVLRDKCARSLRASSHTALTGGDEMRCCVAAETRAQGTVLIDLLPLGQRLARFIYTIVKSGASNPNYWPINLNLISLLSRRLSRSNSRCWNRHCRHSPENSLAHACDSGLRQPGTVRVNIVFIREIAKHIYRLLLSFRCCNIRVVNHWANHAHRLLRPYNWIGAYGFCEFTTISWHNEIGLDNRITHVPHASDSGSIARVSPVDTNVRVAASRVLCCIRSYASKHNIRAVNFGKGHFSKLISLLRLCYLLLGETSVYAYSNQSEGTNSEICKIFYVVPTIIGIALIVHGWYYLTSTPVEGYIPPLKERWLRFGWGFVSLAIGVFVGEYALLHF